MKQVPSEISEVEAKLNIAKEKQAKCHGEYEEALKVAADARQVLEKKEAEKEELEAKLKKEKRQQNDKR